MTEYEIIPNFRASLPDNPNILLGKKPTVYQIVRVIKLYYLAYYNSHYIKKYTEETHSLLKQLTRILTFDIVMQYLYSRTLKISNLFRWKTKIVKPLRCHDLRILQEYLGFIIQPKPVFELDTIMDISRIYYSGKRYGKKVFNLKIMEERVDQIVRKFESGLDQSGIMGKFKPEINMDLIELKDDIISTEFPLIKGLDRNLTALVLLDIKYNCRYLSALPSHIDSALEEKFKKLTCSRAYSRLKNTNYQAKLRLDLYLRYFPDQPLEMWKYLVDRHCQIGRNLRVFLEFVRDHNLTFVYFHHLLRPATIKNYSRTSLIRLIKRVGYQHFYSRYGVPFLAILYG